METELLAYDHQIDTIAVSGTPWTTIQEWFDNCTSNHRRCNQPLRQDKWYPSRLLNLRGPKASIITLIDTATMLPDGPYISLSHRWGTASVTMTTQDTLQMFMNGIECSSLPKIFQDAVVVARKLGAHYLWIDSLCIIQGDSDDWQHEAALMHHVYRNAVCNLSALGAESSHDGLLFPRTAESVQPLTVEVAWKDFPRETYAVIDEEFWTDRVHNAPLNYRGWVFQERLLAPRLLHFGAEQVFWECHEMDACEMYPQGLPQVLRQDHLKRFKALNQGSNITFQAENPSAKQVSIHDDYNIWHNLVKQYTKCNLTMDEDKLVAISGIAKIFQSKLRDEYLAGLWRRILLDELLWMAGPRENESRGRATSRPKKYRAPSWSWASIDGVINPHGHSPAFDNEKGSMATILDAKISLLSQDPTGQVIEGVIRLRGFLYPRRLEIKNTTFRMATMFDIHDNYLTEFVYDVRPTPRTQTRVIYCLPLSFRDDGDDFTMWGLGLEPVGLRQGVYRRFGMFNVNGKDQCKALQEEPEDAEERRKLYCEEEDGVLVII